MQWNTKSWISLQPRPFTICGIECTEQPEKAEEFTPEEAVRLAKWVAEKFGKNGARKIITGKRVKWSVNEISKAIKYQSSRSNLYNLQLKDGFPFPAVRTLQNWMKKVSCRPGIIAPVVAMMTAEGKKLTDMDKVCVLMADEMKFREVFEFEEMEGGMNTNIVKIGEKFSAVYKKNEGLSTL